MENLALEIRREGKKHYRSTGHDGRKSCSSQQNLRIIAGLEKSHKKLAIEEGEKKFRVDMHGLLVKKFIFFHLLISRFKNF